MGRSKVVIDITGNAENFKRSLDQIKKETRTLESSLKTIATRGAIAFAGLGAGIGAAVAQAAKFEQINTQFEVLIGNAEDTQKALEELRDFSAGTPFDFPSIAKAGQQLLGFGFAADELRPKLEDIGNVAAAVGKPIDEIGLIFGQVAAAGKLTGERLLQFQERAIPIGPAIAETLGVAESSVKDLVSKGLVDFATFEKAFASLSREGGVAFGALEKQSQTVSGQFSTLKDNVSLLVADFGQEFFPIIKAVTQGLTAFIQVLRDNKEITKYAAIIVGVTTAAAGLLATIGAVGLGIVKFQAVVAAATAASPLFAAALGGIGAAATAAGTAIRFAFANPLGLAITGVVAAGVAVFNFRKEISAAFGAALDVVRDFSSRAGDNLAAFGKILRGIATFNISTIKEGFQELTNLEGEGTRAAATFSEGYAKRMEEFKEEEAARQEELTQIRLEKQAEENELKLEQNAEFRQAQLEQKNEFDKQEVDAETLKLRKAFQARKANLKSDEKEKQKAEKERLKQEKKVEQQQLDNRNQFFGNLETLKRANDKRLFAIGKAASLAQAIINTAEGASKALAQGGIVGPVLAAAVAAAGAVQIATISSQTFQAQKGFSGSGSAFGESFVSTFTPREIVVPERFSEGIKKGEFSLAKAGADNEGSGGGSMEVTIGFTDDAFEIIETKLIERETLGDSFRGS